MWKRKQNKLFLGGAAIFLFVLGMFVGGFLNDFAGENRADEGDMDESTFFSPKMQKSLEQLETFVDYAITMYCDEKSIENLYSFHLLEDMLHYYTCIYDVRAKYTYDLNKLILPELANNRFLIKAEGAGATIYVEVNTYRMKLYVYEEDKIGRLITGEAGGDPLLDRAKPEECVKCDWPDDMWNLEYKDFVIEGWEYLQTPDFDTMLQNNPDLYGMVIYSVRRYCEERGIQEMFHFEFPKDKVGSVTVRIFTVKVTSDNRVLYMDIDMDRNKVHIYQVE